MSASADSVGSPGRRIGPRSQGDRSALSGDDGIDALFITQLDWGRCR
jgi:hypothetical protein